MARWLEVLAEFDYTVVHRAGKQHTNADALSRGRQCGRDKEVVEDDPMTGAGNVEGTRRWWRMIPWQVQAMWKGRGGGGG